MTGYDHKDLLTLKKLIKDDGWLMRRLVNLAWVALQIMEKPLNT